MISNDDISNLSSRTPEEGNQENDIQNQVMCDKSDSLSVTMASQSSGMSSATLSNTCTNNNALIESTKVADNKQYDNEESMMESSNSSDESYIYFGNSIPEGHKSASGFEDVVLVATTDNSTYASSSPILSNAKHEQLQAESDKGDYSVGTVLRNESFIDTVSSSGIIDPDSLDSSILEMDSLPPIPSEVKPVISSPFLYSPFPNVNSQFFGQGSKQSKRPKRNRGRNFPSCVKKRILDLYDDLRYHNPSAQIRYIAAIIEMRIREEFKDLDLNSSVLTFLYNSRRAHNNY